MKFLALLSVFVVGSLAFPSKEQFDTEWHNFKKIHQKSYNTFEDWKRKTIFENNVRKIEEHNKLYEENKVTYKMGINQFADMTSEEFLQFLNSQKKAGIKPIRNQLPLTSDVPDQIDWREKGAVTDVKNQGQCGSASIFSATGSLEGANFVKNGVLVELSEQELIDCATENGGCNGGFVEDDFEYVLKHGLASAKDYPYEDTAGTCRRDDIPSAVVETDYILLPEGNEDRLKEAVGITGPVSVEVNASEGWQFYVSGVFYDELCSATELNHAAVAVGYGAEDGTEFWIVKNSWGSSWGESGYIRTARNRDNNCGIASHAIYPVVA